MILVDRHGTPLAIDTESASRNESILIEPLFVKMTCKNHKPERIIYDKAGDVDRIRDKFQEAVIDYICPHRRGRTRAVKQDGRKIRRYKRRWIVERTIAWLHNYRRIVTRWERHDFLYEGFVALGCAFTLLKRF
ncbi:transposase [Rubinisphaera italica]|uniref:Transposase DDE domain protein n=1 Tax=Rubinisphaera italica TaxID=2527969 RepID=A0A5C5X9H8_9PLAN|nr:transposase [Rubinisphaera italica]TWT59600.1 Transposase DDE domain protein [Rubinisphaera italica]